MIAGIASNRKNNHNKATISKKRSVTLLSLRFLFFVFKENSGTSAFIINALKKLIKTKIYGVLKRSKTKSLEVVAVISGILRINRAFAGVGNRIKMPICRESSLNCPNDL